MRFAGGGSVRGERRGSGVGLDEVDGTACLSRSSARRKSSRRRRGHRGCEVMTEREITPLRMLIANERRDRLALLREVVIGLGHEVVAIEIDVSDVAAATSREHPDVALVGLGESTQHALELIELIVRESSCPVIALLPIEDPAFIRAAANAGVFAYIVDTIPDELQSAIDITLRRFAEYHD